MDARNVAVLTAAGIAAVVLAILCFTIVADWSERSVNIALLLTGGFAGIVIGIIATPFDPKEKKEFNTYVKAASVFLSGYIISKADDLAKEIFSPAVLLQPLPGFRALLFLASFLIAFVVALVLRKYV